MYLLQDLDGKTILQPLVMFLVQVWICPLTWLKEDGTRSRQLCSASPRVNLKPGTAVFLEICLLLCTLLLPQAPQRVELLTLPLKSLFSF